MNLRQKFSEERRLNKYYDRIDKIRLSKVSKEIENPTSETKQNISEVLIENNEFHEQIILEEFKKDFPEWYKENSDKIISHKDGVEFKGIEGLEGKKIQRDNLKVKTPNEVDVFSISKEKLEHMADEEMDSLKDEQLFTYDSAIREAEKQGLGLISDDQWQNLINTMPGVDMGKKSINFRKLLNIQFSGYRSTNGSFYSQGSYGFYWSSTEYNSTYARYQAFNSSNENTSSNNKNAGFSVRCIED